ncbi:MAG: alpha/beta fold hydrolase [Alphaproteobacteria bacterium]|nr:alpha/beta fold hydrolase [Alphaproteobacteria bacterium]
MTAALFLPGAGGDPAFWHSVGARLPESWLKTYLGWPGLGDQPHDPAIRGLDDLVARAGAALDARSVVIAQSMGGIVAIRLALAHAARISHLVLVATSGGIDLAPFGVSDWRADYRRNFPRAAAWITEARADHAAQIPSIAIPTLLIWGDRDPISPVAVGMHLQRVLPRACLEIVSGGTHALATEQPARVAALIAQHVETA